MQLSGGGTPRAQAMARSAEQPTGLFRSLRNLRAGAPARLAACPTSIGTTLVFQSRIEGMGIQHGVHTAADISDFVHKLEEASLHHTG